MIFKVQCKRGIKMKDFHFFRHKFLIFFSQTLFIFIQVFVANSSMATLIHLKLYKSLSMGHDQSEVLVVSIDDSATVAEFKRKLEELNFDPDTLVHIAKSSGMDDSLTLQDYGIETGFKFKAKMAESSKDKLRDNFIKAVVDGDAGTVTTNLSKIPPAERRAFLENVRAKDDHNKISLYYAARRGRLNVLLAVEKLISKEDMIHLHSLEDDEGRTLLMAAAQVLQTVSDSDRRGIVDFALKYTDAESLKKVSTGKFFSGTAYDWAVTRGEEDVAILRKLLVSSGTKNSSKGCSSGEILERGGISINSDLEDLWKNVTRMIIQNNLMKYSQMM